jgi:hypothetical protein
MQLDNDHDGVFESIPDFGFIVNLRGIILKYTCQVKSITQVNGELEGSKYNRYFHHLKEKHNPTSRF